MPETIPASAVIPTRNRSATLARTLQSLALQSVQPAEIFVIDASDDGRTRELCESPRPAGLRSEIVWREAATRGAASQRNEAAELCGQPFVLFIDDDILFEEDCVARLWSAIGSDPEIGGVNAMITNCKYTPPGPVSRRVFGFLNRGRDESYAGKIIGPAVNLLPEDRPDLPETVPVEWMNLTCVLYRRAALPQPWLPSHFEGYSLFEDVTLSLAVRLTNGWKIANARTARIFHDSQPGDHKSSPFKVSRMEVLNRHYVMTSVLGRTGAGNFLRMVVFHCYKLASLLRRPAGWPRVAPSAAGILHAVWTIARRNRSPETATP